MSATVPSPMSRLVPRYGSCWWMTTAYPDSVPSIGIRLGGLLRMFDVFVSETLIIQ